MIVVGLDLSLTSTGAARIYTFEHEPPAVLCDRIVSTGKKDASLEDRWERLRNLRNGIADLTKAADLVVVEGPSYGSKTGSQHDRSGLWWLVVAALHRDGIDVAEVPPSTRMRYATGKGQAGKDIVLSNVVRRYPNVIVQTNDEADALVLAAMGARHLGVPIDDLPKTHLAAMDAVRWPN